MSDEKSFKSRVSDVFGCLDKVDFKTDSSLKQEKPKQQQLDNEGFRRPRSPVRTSHGGDRGGTREPSRSLDRFQKTESIFQETPDVGSWKQRDNRPPPRPGRSDNSQGRSRPPKNPMYDHRRPQRRDPSKYTKYSLADVDDVTDRSNTAAALEFLNSRKRSSDDDGAADDDQEGSSSAKVVFKKPKKTTNPEKESSSKDTATKSAIDNYGLSCGNSKRVMPAAVVGRQATKKKGSAGPEGTDQKQKSKKPKQKKLSHLDFEEDDD